MGGFFLALCQITAILKKEKQSRERIKTSFGVRILFCLCCKTMGKKSAETECVRLCIAEALSLKSTARS
jgi:hypothetical protein